jgi:hypothetical protein
MEQATRQPMPISAKRSINQICQKARQSLRKRTGGFFYVNTPAQSGSLNQFMQCSRKHSRGFTQLPTTVSFKNFLND